MAVPNKQRATHSGLIFTSTPFASTPGANAFFSPSFVGSRLFNSLNHVTFAALDKKMALGSDILIRVSRPLKN